MPVASSLRAFATQTLTVDDTVGGVGLNLTYVLATPPAQAVVLTLATAQIRWFADGTAPTATVGHQMNPTDVLTLNHPSELFNFKAIRTGAVSGVGTVSYYR